MTRSERAREAANAAWCLEPGQEREDALTKAVYYLAGVVEDQQKEIDRLSASIERRLFA